jgi:serine/threonine-protein kinase
MAEVFLATSRGVGGFNKLLVVKRLRDIFATDPSFVAMFLDEARLAARLNHPNVVHTYDVGEEHGAHFLAMEYIEGQSLHGIFQRLGRAAVPRRLHLRILADVLAGLHAAHELTDYDGQPLGVVHRDVSPHNVLVSYGGQVKVVDFGIAKALDSSSQTSTGVIKGKVSYMAPEQAAGDRALDRRADVFAVGIMLWEALTGERIFKGLNNHGTLANLLRSDGSFAPPSSIHRDIDPALDAICARALAWSKEERYSSAREMQGVIERYLHDHGGPVDSDEIAALLREPFADDRNRIRALVEEAIRSNRSSSSLPATTSEGSLDSPRAVESSSSVSRPSASHPGASLDLTGDTNSSGIFSSISTASRGALALLTAVALAALLFTGSRLFPRSSSALVRSAPPLAAPSSSVVLVQFTTTPAGARLFWDGQPAGTAPFAESRPRDGLRHRIRAEAPGHDASELEIVLDRELAMDISLEPTAPQASAVASAKPAPGGAPRPPAPKAPPPASTAAPPATPASPAAPIPAPLRPSPSFENPFGN